MKRLDTAILFAAVLLVPALSQNAANPLTGRWDFNIAANAAAWLGIAECRLILRIMHAAAVKIII